MKKIKRQLVMIAFLLQYSVCFGVGNFLDISYSPRASAMGNSQIASATSIDSLMWNPSLLQTGLLKNSHPNPLTATLSGFQAYETNFFTLQTQTYIGQFPIGIQWVRASLDGFNESILNQATGRHVLTGNTFGFNGDAVIVGTAYSIHGITAGASVKGVSEKSDAYEASGLAVDIGVSTHPLENLNLGATIKNVWSSDFTITTTGTTEKLKKSYGIGAAYVFPGSHQISIDALIINYRPAILAIGSEFDILSIAKLRGGYANNAWAFGAGLMLERMTIDVSVTLNPDYLGNMYQFALGF